MEWVETTAKTVEEAKEAALDTLGVDEVDAEFEILEEPRQGLFGRQRGEARVRARVRPTSPRPKAERRSRTKKKPAEGASPNVRSTDDPSTDDDDAAVVTEESPSPPRRALAPDVAAAVAAAAEETAAPAPTGGRQRGGRSGGRSNGDRGRPPAGDNGGATMAEEELSIAEQGTIAEQFVVGLLEKFRAPATVTHRVVDDDTVEVDVTGEELGLLIGPKGQTLQAVQELSRTVVQRKSVARTGRVHVDISGYRSKRREALARFTTQVAQDVASSGVQRVLEPMSAPDRKVVHDTATDIAGVRTISEGEEPRRRVVILPDPA